MRGGPSGVVAGCFGLTAFVVAIVAGLAAANSAVIILGRALLVMIVCYPLGLVVGLLCQRVVGSSEEAEDELPETVEEPGEETGPEDGGADDTPAPEASDQEALAV